MYKRNIIKQNFQTEKEKYAKHLENTVFSALGVKKGQYDVEKGRRIPLGKHVSQMEMTNPEARRQLREMLEFQMREKEHNIQNDETISHAKQRLLRQPVTANLQNKRPISGVLQASASQQMLPQIRNNTANSC